MLLVTAIGAAVGSGSSGSGSPAGSSAGSSSAGSDPAPAAQVASGHQLAGDGDFAFRFKGMACGETAGQAVYSGPDVTGAQPAGTTECIVEVRITDDKDEAQTFWDSNQYAYDARGRQLSAHSNGVYLTGDQNATQLNPGVTVTALLPVQHPGRRAFRESRVRAGRGADRLGPDRHRVRRPGLPGCRGRRHRGSAHAVALRRPHA